MKLICQKWEESERGWGTRPDGYTLHPSLEALEDYIKRHWAEHPEDRDHPPDEYSRPDGTPYWCEVPDDDETVAEGMRLRKYFRALDNNYPARLDGQAQIDGWRPAK